MSDVMYVANFNLTLPVRSFDLAEDCLNQFDMAKFVPDELKSKIETVEWHLKDTESGTITVKANTELTEQESAKMSEWISGQCSDGLGEVFEQQSFAEWVLDSYGELHDPKKFPVDDPDGDPDAGWQSASFDWKNDSYELIRV